MSVSHQPDLVVLDRDHPGFRDAGYRARRNAIARVANEYTGGPVPTIAYTDDEHAVWRLVRERLDPLHRALAARALVDASDRLGLRTDRIPQLEELNATL